MYTNTYAFEHIFFSETPAYMALLMGAAMAVIMLSFMRTMIPHHSIAIMTSERANFSDPRVQKLADELIAAQRNEIEEVRHPIADIEENGVATDPALGEAEAPAEEGTVEDALSSVQLAGFDMAGLKPEEIEAALESDATCEFRRTTEGEPVLAMAGASDAIKLPAVLIPLAAGAAVAVETIDAGARLAAEGVEIPVMPDPGVDWTDADSSLRRAEAEMTFHLEQGLRWAIGASWTAAHRPHLCRAQLKTASHPE